MPKELVSFYVSLLTVTLYIQWYQFIIVHVSLPKLYNQVPSSFILVKKRLHLNPLNIVTFLTVRVVFGDHPTRIKTISTIFKSKFVEVKPQIDRNIVVPTVCLLSKKSIILFIRVLVMYPLPD